ncbi:diguanylate cyclase domain-containing protein [Novosphingobium album (ex Liu et al. 2023)]|uniref:Diguanylate cyclase n=1 Tax=Novosphingobium album (ex Liu et al. 2023) TaxID=3031130 RepID=A0ABT5WL59_9SPHN|nr:diguanylate cyclase [Novosphingobium album (ex Liu et al. 2023)]MDE8650761.1 diguanylate cyclase [Novosphingobium album (ex Liu et al. 2023)]
MTGAPPSPQPTLRHLLGQVHRKLILFAVIVAGITMLVSGFLVIHGYAARNLVLIAQTVSYTIEPAIVFGDREAIRSGIASVVGADAVASVEVLDADGRRLATWTRPVSDGMASRLEQAASRLIWPTPVTRDIARNGETIAQVRVRGSAGGIAGYLLSGAIVSLLCLTFTIVVTNLLARRLQDGVLAPLTRIGEVAHAVRTERAFGRRVPVSGLAEIDKLVQDFNSLLEELQGWHTGITRENQELVRQALQDPLTGLGNRAAFEQRLQLVISESVANDTGFAILYLDANRFKAINDVHGHDAGDSILRAIAGRLRLAVRQQDSAFRLGGDEFSVILAPCPSRGHTAAVVSRITEAIEPPMALPDGSTIAMTLSIGLAFYPEDGTDPLDLVRRADKSMYQEKFRRREFGHDESPC